MGSIEGARTALERKWALMRDGEREITRANDLVSLAILEGDIDAARRNLDEWERLATQFADARVRAVYLGEGLVYDARHREGASA